MLLVMPLKCFTGFAYLGYRNLHSFRHNGNQIRGTGVNGADEVGMSFSGICQRF
jgi:hypothetical protein